MSSSINLPTSTAVSTGTTLNCGSGGGSNSLFGLRVASIFIILLGSLFGALFPVLAHRSTWLHVPKGVFDFAKYFGSGVIIATAFIHLLGPAIEELGSDCLADAWSVYPYALAFALLSMFCIFIVEIFAFRWGTTRLHKLGIRHDAHGHNVGSLSAHGPEGYDEKEMSPNASGSKSTGDIESHQHHGDLANAAAGQIIGVAILEFGVILHSVLVGLTLAVNEDFKVLFVVLVFHQTFEGLGIGSRLATMKLPPRFNYVPVVAAILYGITTPMGIAIGLGVRSTYNPGSTTSSIVSGILDSLSAGILIYTGLVELLAHEFVFNKEMINGSTSHLLYALSCLLLGCGVMALLGRWA